MKIQAESRRFGTTIAFPRSRPRRPASATVSAGSDGKRTLAPGASPATRWKSVRVVPGQRAVTTTPRPRSSSWSACEYERTNAFVAA